MGLFKNLFRKKEKKREHKTLDVVDELKAELEEVQRKKERTEAYISELNIKEKAYRQYEKLDAKSISQITLLAQKAKSLEERKEELRARLVSNNPALYKVSQYEKQIPEWIKEMQKTEFRQKETQMHIDRLKEEQLDLEDERDMLLSEYKILKWISFAFIVFLGVSLLVSFVLLHILREKIWFVLSGLVIIMFFFIVVLVLSKEKLEKELRNNEILQQKAVRYLNQSAIRLYNQTNYLEYMYKKLGVDSTGKLESYYATFLRNKNNERTYLKINETINDIEEDILYILHKKDVLLKDIGKVTDWILSPTLLDEIKALHEEKQKTVEQYEDLIKQEKKLKNEIDLLNGIDEVPEIPKILQDETPEALPNVLEQVATPKVLKEKAPVPKTNLLPKNEDSFEERDFLMRMFKEESLQADELSATEEPIEIEQTSEISIEAEEIAIIKEPETVVEVESAEEVAETMTEVESVEEVAEKIVEAHESLEVEEISKELEAEASEVIEVKEPKKSLGSKIKSLFNKKAKKQEVKEEVPAIVEAVEETTAMTEVEVEEEVPATVEAVKETTKMAEVEEAPTIVETVEETTEITEAVEEVSEIVETVEETTEMLESVEQVELIEVKESFTSKFKNLFSRRKPDIEGA